MPPDLDLYDKYHREPQRQSKYTKSKMPFPDDQSVMKAVFLALREITRKWWTLPIRNWSLVVNQFINIFEERCKI